MYVSVVVNGRVWVYEWGLWVTWLYALLFLIIVIVRAHAYKYMCKIAHSYDHKSAHMRWLTERTTPTDKNVKVCTHVSMPIFCVYTGMFVCMGRVTSLQLQVYWKPATGVTRPLIISREETGGVLVFWKSYKG